MDRMLLGEISQIRRRELLDLAGVPRPRKSTRPPEATIEMRWPVFATEHRTLAGLIRAGLSKMMQPATSTALRVQSVRHR
jgi:hypothetical protein